MESIYELTNNYYLKKLDNFSKLPNYTVNIEKTNYNFIKMSKILFVIDFDKIDRKKYKKILRSLLSKRKTIMKRININGNKLLGYLINYNENDKLQKAFLCGINSILYNNRYERYSYIYDTVCDYLDSFFYGKNLCDFKENKCGEKRITASSSNVGCCHHYKNKILGPLLSNNFITCEYLNKDNSCGAKCISCKLFTCDYLEKKGIKFRIKDILLLDTFFNPLQKYFIKCMVFNPKDKIIKRLMKI